VSPVPFQSAIGVELVVEDPLVSDDVERTGCGTRSWVLLTIKEANSSSMAQCQFRLVRAAWAELGTDDMHDAKVADRVSLSADSWKPHFVCVVIE
jgi:hypothetical protein